MFTQCCPGAGLQKLLPWLCYAGLGLRLSVLHRIPRAATRCAKLCVFAIAIVGYLNPDAGNKLLSHLASSSAANSRIIMTAPPAPNIHAEVVAAHFLAKLPLCLPAFVRRLLEGVVRSVVHVLMFLGVVNGKKGGPKLHHETKEQPSETLKR